jgi:hypothetical protein
MCLFRRVVVGMEGSRLKGGRKYKMRGTAKRYIIMGREGGIIIPKRIMWM